MTNAQAFDVAFKPQIKVELEPVGIHWNGKVDDGLGFPAPATVVETYCSLCAWRDLASDGEEWCEHKAAVRDALAAELDGMGLAFDGESEKRAANLRIAIRDFDRIEEKWRAA